MNSNATLLGIMPLGTSLLWLWLILTLLFTVMKPEASLYLGFVPRSIFWCLHIGCALLSIWMASWLIRHWLARVKPALLTVLITGCFGALLGAPLFVGLEYVYPHCNAGGGSLIGLLLRLGW